MKKWIEEWLALFELRCSTEVTTHLGCTRCSSTFSSMDTRAMSMERMMQHPNRHTETSRPGNNWQAEFTTTSRPVWANNSWVTFWMETIFAARTTAKKLQLRLELSNVRQRDMTVADYTSKIKDICDSLASIDVNVEEGEMVQICLGGLASKFGAFRIAVCTRENTPSFFDLQSMLLVEENHMSASTSTHADNKMLYTDEDRPRAHGGRGESARNGGGWQEEGRRQKFEKNRKKGRKEADFTYLPKSSNDLFPFLKEEEAEDEDWGPQGIVADALRLNPLSGLCLFMVKSGELDRLSAAFRFRSASSEMGLRGSDRMEGRMDGWNLNSSEMAPSTTQIDTLHTSHTSHTYIPLVCFPCFWMSIFIYFPKCPCVFPYSFFPLIAPRIFLFILRIHTHSS